MSTVDEVLAAAEVVDAVCVIDGETRIISVPTEYKELGVESDEKVTRVKFQCPKIVGDNIDLTGYNLYINYRNAGNKLNSYLVEDVTVTGDTINFSWLLSRHVTESPGTINYIVCAKKSDNTGVINEWNTKVATGTVGIGLEATEEIEEQNIDAIEQILRSIVELENKVDSGGSGGYYSPAVDADGNLSWTASKTGMPAVDGANIKGPQGVSGVYVGSGDMPDGYNVQIDPDGTPSDIIPTIDETLTAQGKAADAKATGDAIRSLSEEKVSLPKAEDGTAIPGTAGWYAVSDGVGGITWVESAPSTGGETTHGIAWNLVNVTSSNNAVSVADGASLVAVLTPADGYTLGDVTITMGGEVVTGAWNADTATVTIQSVTGDVVISCAGVEQTGPVDTSPNIRAYDTGWNGDGVATQTLTGTYANTTGLCILEPYEFTLDVDALKASSKYDAANDYLTMSGSAVAICVYTPFTNYRAKASGYSGVIQVTKNVYFADGNVLHTGSNNSFNTDSPTVLTFKDDRYLTAVLTASKLSFSCTLSTDDLDDSYAYFTSTMSGVMPIGVREGDIIFAGKNTPYYGMANVDGTMLGGETATALSLDDDIAQDYGVATLSLTPDLSADTSTTYGLASAYASVLETIRDEWMIEYNGNANKIPIIIHTDQHGRMTNGGNVKGLFNTIGKAFSLHDISKVMNLGDTVAVEWQDADAAHPLLSCTALENYLSTVEAIPFSKRLEVFGNHDTWYYNGYNDAGNAVGTRYPSTQNHLYKYFRNIYKKSNGNNTGYFAVCDDYFNVKYVVVSAYEYQNGTISDRMTSEQIEWIIREFSKNDGYDIVVVSHCPLYWDDTTGTFPEGAPTTTETLRIADDWIDALWAGRKNKTSGTVNDSDGGPHTFDFTGCTSNLLCALHGHTHRAGYNYVSNSLLSVAFDWFANESMYFCLIDRENRELKVWKFIGSDGDAPEYLTWVAPFDKQ